MFLSASGKGIIVTVAALLATGIVLILVRVATVLKQGGRFDVSLKRIGLLDYREARFAIAFENQSKSDKEMRSLRLGWVKNGVTHFLAPMAYAPLARGFDPNFVKGSDGEYSFFLERGKEYGAVIDFLIPVDFRCPQGAAFCVIFENGKGVTHYASVSLSSPSSQLLRFKKSKRPKGR